MKRITNIADQPESGDYSFEVDGVSIPFRYKRGAMNGLVILFHGGMNREKRPHPFFQPFLPINVSQVAIADPTLAADAKIASGWFIGAEGWDLPTKLSGLLRALGRVSKATRRIYVGASAGGFGAMLYSSMDQGSVAIAANPQIHLPNYANSHFERLRKECWPSCATVEEFEQKAPISISKIYSEPVNNRVIYVQSSGDYGHIKTQLIHLTSNLHQNNIGRLILDVGYWGIPGHSGSVPPHAWLPWVRAVLSAKSLDPDDLLDTRHTIAEAAAPDAKSASPEKSSAFDAADIAMADKVRDYLMSLRGA